MRLSANDIAVIRSLVHDRFGASAGIWLFGSRLDDAARGGDIDLYVELASPVRDNLFLARQALRRELERRLRQPVDLIVNAGRPTAFMRQARSEGQPL
jgi:predicted nucleotidyltransferase